MERAGCGGGVCDGVVGVVEVEFGGLEVVQVQQPALHEPDEAGDGGAGVHPLGYTQSVVSRQVAALERTTGARLFDRRPDGGRSNYVRSPARRLRR